MNTLLKNYYKKQTITELKRLGLLLLWGFIAGIAIEAILWVNGWLAIRDILLFNI
jgi:hypothetical protein